MQGEGGEQSVGVYGFHETEAMPKSYETGVLTGFATAMKESGGPVVDVGTGAGGAADYLISRGVQTIKYDILQSGLADLSGNKVAGKLNRLPFGKGMVGGFHIKDALVHEPDRYFMFKQMAESLKPGGQILITEVERERSVVTAKVREGSEEREVSYDIGLLEEKAVRKYLMDTQPGIVESSISPPFYKISQEEIMKIANQTGLRVDSVDEWTPEEGEKDWYEDDKPTKRFVIVLKK